MGFTKVQLLARLQVLQIKFSQYEHPVVLTVEAQAKYVGHLKGALSKNLFLKDKKQRYYIVSALADAKVDLKVLSQRLGLGKGGVRMAPEEALAEILQVPLGCVTPFALVNETARNVSLLLDQGFKAQECCFFHPLSNDMTIALSTSDLDKFLNSIGKSPAYVDLEANPSVGKDQPPDLASLVPSDATDSAEPPKRNLSTQGFNNNHVSVNKQSEVAESKTVKPTTTTVKGKSQDSEKLQTAFADPDKCVQEIMEKITSLVMAEIDKNIDREQLGAVVSESISKQLGVELKNIATMLKNTAYAEGFMAGNKCRPKRM